jgi:uncharacterized protein (TIGR02594 family)
MISRRAFGGGLLASQVFLRAPASLGDEQREQADSTNFVQLIYPPFGAINQPEKFGYAKPSADQKDRAIQIENQSPKGPTPVAIAQSFAERYGKSDPKAISQWPAPDAWNPLIVDFFKSTASPVNNDMIAWCAAFANWCIERNGKTGTRSASSQSFIDPKNSKYFIRTDSPDAGDLAVWTCYDSQSGKNLGLGHVAFVTGKPSEDSVPTVSGNTSDDNHYSIIAEKQFSIKDRKVYRTIGGTRVPSVMKLNTYLRLA